MKNFQFLGLYFTFMFLFHVSCAHEKKPKIGLLVMATGKYTIFLEPLFTSADKFFLPGYERTYFVFTDGEVPQSDHVIRIEQKRLGWPYDTMMRFQVYLKAAEYFKDIDYLFAIDADMLFVDEVGEEIIGDRVVTRHPGYSLPEHRREDYDRNPLSKACVSPGEGEYYFAGGFYGGSKQEMLRLFTTCTRNILDDLSRNVIAKWHDESHLNRYSIDNPPLVILSPSYCYPEEWDLPFERKLLAIYKNHKYFQTDEMDH